MTEITLFSRNHRKPTWLLAVFIVENRRLYGARPQHALDVAILRG